MRKKIKKILIWVFSITNFIILLTLLILVLTLKINWWWFFGFLIPSFLGWIIFGIIQLVSADKKVVLEKVELDDAIELAQEHSLHHPGNPDNFIPTNHHLSKVGESGAEKTPILTIVGKGTEKAEDRYFVINKKDRTEFAMLINPTQRELNQRIIEIAESQPQPVITESVPGTDAFGRPTMKYIQKTTSRAEITKKEEEKKAEEELGV